MRGDGRVFRRKGESPYWWISYYRHEKEHREVACHLRTLKKITATETEEEKPEAEKFLKKRLAEVREEQNGGRPFVGAQAKRLKVSDLLDALENDFKLRGKGSAQTLSNLARARKDFGFYRAVNITAEQIDGYIEQRLADGTAKASINSVTQLLAQSFNLAIRRNRLPNQP